MRCTRDACEFGGFDGYTEVWLPGAKEPTRFDGCPAKHIAEVSVWIEAYNRWKTWGKTPVEMGLVTADRLDPRYWEAVELVAWAIRQHEPKAT